MRKILFSKEVRELLGKVVCIVLSATISVMCIDMGNIFVALVSFALMGLLCVGFGYAFCKSEAKLGEVVREQVDAETAVPNCECKAKAKAFEEKVSESVDNGENV